MPKIINKEIKNTILKAFEVVPERVFDQIFW